MRLERLVVPAAAEGFDELNGSDEALAGEFSVGAFGLQRLAARIHHLKITDDSGTIPVSRQIRGATGIGHGALLRLGLAVQKVNAGEAVFHFAESDEDTLAIERDGFLAR